MYMHKRVEKKYFPLHHIKLGYHRNTNKLSPIKNVALESVARADNSISLAEQNVSLLTAWQSYGT